MELRGQGDKLQDLWKRDVGIAVDRLMCVIIAYFAIKGSARLNCILKP